MGFLHIETFVFILMVNLSQSTYLPERTALSYQYLSCKASNGDTCSLGWEGEAATYMLLANKQREASKPVLPTEHQPDLELKVWAWDITLLLVCREAWTLNSHMQY